jgi:hypothetical protein
VAAVAVGSIRPTPDPPAAKLANLRRTQIVVDDDLVQLGIVVASRNSCVTMTRI